MFVALLALRTQGETDFPKTLTGKVISIADGDTLTLLDAQNNKERIRLAGIDAPETKQAYSAKSKAAISKTVKGKQVRVQWNARDKYGRIIGHVYVGDVWLNLSQVENGWAWHYKRYSKDKKLVDADTHRQKRKTRFVDRQCCADGTLGISQITKTGQGFEFDGRHAHLLAQHLIRR